MEIVVVGGHGQIALLLEPLLAGAGHGVRALIRRAEHADDVRAAGARPVLCDVEALDGAEIAAAVGAADAFVFAAGAGPGSGPARKWTVDHQGVVKTVAAARELGARRYVVISAIGADAGASDDGAFGTYLKAKGMADDDARASGLDWTIVCPGRLTDGPPAGRVSAGADVAYGEIPRADVAAVVAGVLATPATVGRTFNVVGGETPIADALAALA